MSRRSLPTTALLLTIFFTVIYSGISFYFSSLILIAKRDTADLASIQQINFDPPKQVEVFTLNHYEHPLQLWRFVRSSEALKPACAIIFIHGWGANRTDMNKFHVPFENTLCDFITYDLRGHGIDPHRFSSGGILEKRDLLNIHDFLVQMFALTDKQIGWFGVSMGGSAALQAAALEVEPAFVIADSPYQDWETAIFERGEEMYGTWVNAFRPGVNFAIYLRSGIWFRKASAIAVAKKVRAPALLIHSRSDSDTASSQSQAIFNALSPNKTRFHHTKWGADHAKDIDIQPDEYAALIMAFMKDFAPQML